MASEGPSPARIIAAAGSVSAGIGLVALLAGTAAPAEVVVHVEPTPVVVTTPPTTPAPTLAEPVAPDPATAAPIQAATTPPPTVPTTTRPPTTAAPMVTTSEGS